ncbi:MAG: polysaccharide biosynthesis protein [Candidatus Thioglobus sp.]|nr:polysaccharide biosynthesis protein [Candidatus Thioglobus sp.]
MLQKLLNISRVNKQLIMILLDSFMLISILLAAFSVRLGYWYFPQSDLIWTIFGAPIIAVVIFIRFGLYHLVIRYIGFKALWSVVQAVSLYSLIWGIIGFMAAVDGIPRSVILINWLLAIVAISGSRMAASWLLAGRAGKFSKQKRVAIYGAGEAGRQLLVALQQSYEYQPLFFIDDSTALHKQIINGVKVQSPKSIENLIQKQQISEILLAMPSVSHGRLREVLDFLAPLPVVVRSLPGVSELAQGKVNIADIKSLSVEDLLGRDTVVADSQLLGQNISGQVVLVTGAGGSIGSELCRQIVSLQPKALILYEMSELALYNISQELSAKTEIFALLGSVNNKSRLLQICRHFCVQTIYHAAAYKHVPLVEFNNTEGVNNNVFGTLNCAAAAIEAKVETFVLISTDKAVRPTNTMGASKRCAELVLQALSATQKVTKFSMVRFGNVLGSSGSVIPLFTQQINAGGPITVTDKNITRYFMTIPEAVELVIQAGAMGNKGDVFVLDMGEPVRIADLAKQMIHLSGLEIKDSSNPNGDIEIEFTGLRPGEKLFEELLISDNTFKTEHPMILRAEEEMLDWADLEQILVQLKTQIDANNPQALRDLLLKTITNFKPQCAVADLLNSN